VVKTVTYGSSGDGVDCNGALVQNGGELYIYGQSSGDNSPIDTNDGYSFNSGAKVLGAGAAGMEGSAPESGSGKYLTYGSNGNMQPGMPDNNNINNNFNNNFNNNNTNNNGTPPELPGNTAVSDNSSIDAGGNPPEMPDSSNNNTSNGNPPEMPDSSNNTSNGNPPEMPDSSNNTSNGNPPEMPDSSNNTSNGNPPELPDNNSNNNTGIPVDNGQGASFKAGQYWVVSDSEGKVVDSGKLEYAGSFIVYGSPLIEDGTYTLSVSDTGDEPGNGSDDPKEAGEDPAKSGNEAGKAGVTLSSNAITGSFNVGSVSYAYSYTGTVSYNGQKTLLSDFRINGQGAGATLSGNLIFKKLRYKNNKKTGTAYVIPVFKAAGGSGSSVRKAVREINKYFRTNPLMYTITACELSDEMLSGSAVYRSSSGKWSFSLKADTGASKLIKLRNNRDFTVSGDSPDETKGTVVIRGCGNYTGEATVTGVTIK